MGSGDLSNMLLRFVPDVYFIFGNVHGLFLVSLDWAATDHGDILCWEQISVSWAGLSRLLFFSEVYR